MLNELMNTKQENTMLVSSEVDGSDIDGRSLKQMVLEIEGTLQYSRDQFHQESKIYLKSLEQFGVVEFGDPENFEGKSIDDPEVDAFIDTVVDVLLLNIIQHAERSGTPSKFSKY